MRPSGQVTPVEVVILAVGQLVEAGAVDVHLEQVIEGVLGDVGLVELVGLGGQVRIVFAPGKHHLLGVVGEGRAQEAAGVVEGAGEAFEHGFLGLEALEQVDAAARARPPAVVLVGHVVEAARHALGHQDGVEVQQGIGQGQPALEPAGFEVLGLAVARGRHGLERGEVCPDRELFMRHARAVPCAANSASSRSQKASTSFVRRGHSVARAAS